MNRPVTQYFAKSDAGLVKLINEDSWNVLELEGLECFILADGMGSKKGGIIASKMAVKIARDYLKNNLAKNILSDGKILECLSGTIKSANKSIREEMKKRDLPEMGTTLIIMIVWNQHIYIGNVGDSRAYQLKNLQNLLQITKDHAIVAANSHTIIVEAGSDVLSGYKNLLTRGCGMSGDIKVDTFSIPVDVEKGVFILCSDGLCNMLNDVEIETVLKSDLSLRQKVELYIQLARESGGEDNITVIIVEC